MSHPKPLTAAVPHFLDIPTNDGPYRQRRPPESSQSSVHSNQRYPISGLSPGRSRPARALASQESLVGGPTRSFSMPVPEPYDYSSSTGSVYNYGLSPATRPRPLYVRSAGTAVANIMSDDEKEKRAFQPAVSTDSSSVKDPSNLAQVKDDRAEKVRRMLNGLADRCSAQETRIKGLEWHLTDELAHSRHLSEKVADLNRRLESRRAMFAEIIKQTMPNMSRKLENAKRKSSVVSDRLPPALQEMADAQAKYEKGRQQASPSQTRHVYMFIAADPIFVQAVALEQHLQWRTTPWYTKAKAYLRGERTLNWHDKSSHRWQVIAMILTWVFLIFLVFLILAILAYFFFWNTSYSSVV
ncbi:hypothetical protein FRB99_000779 [Tulasnella sp. 403]|nr:hypothetical protein FRB99_000779 [Tulasnella sp. 403]